MRKDLSSIANRIWSRIKDIETGLSKYDITRMVEERFKEPCLTWKRKANPECEYCKGTGSSQNLVPYTAAFFPCRCVKAGIAGS